MCFSLLYSIVSFQYKYLKLGRNENEKFLFEKENKNLKQVVL